MTLVLMVSSQSVFTLSVLQLPVALPISLYPGLQLNVVSTLVMPVELSVDTVEFTVPLAGGTGRYPHVNVHVGVGFGVGQVESAFSAVQVTLCSPVNITCVPAAGSQLKFATLLCLSPLEKDTMPWFGFPGFDTHCVATQSGALLIGQVESSFAAVHVIFCVLVSLKPASQLKLATLLWRFPVEKFGMTLDPNSGVAHFVAGG